MSPATCGVASARSVRPDADPLEGVIAEDGSGSRLAILVSPRSNQDGIGPLQGDRLRVRVTAPAVDNAANKAVIRLLSDRLAVPRSSLDVTSGQSSRRKTVSFKISVEELRTRVANLLAEQVD